MNLYQTRRMRSFKWVSTVLAVVLSLHPAAGFSSPLTPEEIISQQSMLATSSMITQNLMLLGFVPENTVVDVAGHFDESGFENSLEATIDGGGTYTLSQSGELFGNFGDDITVSVVSSGIIGGEDINVNDELVWLFDDASQDYLDLTWEQNGEVNPIWEAIVIGIAVGIVAGLIANAIYDAIVTDDQGNQTSKQVNVTVNGDKSNCNVTVNDPLSSTSCTFDDDGNLTAQFVVPVPSPSTLFLLFIGLLGLLGLARIRKRWFDRCLSDSRMDGNYLAQKR